MNNRLKKRDLKSKGDNYNENTTKKLIIDNQKIYIYIISSEIKKNNKELKYRGIKTYL